MKSSPSRGGMAIDDLAAFAAQPAGGGFGGPQAGTGGVVIGEDQDAGRGRGQLTCSSPEVESVAQTRQSGPRGHDGEAGLDPLADRERRALDHGPEPDGAAGHAAEHHPGLRDRGLADLPVASSER